MTNKDYVSVVYNETDRPLTSYPNKLTKHLTDRFELKKGDKLLDVGCGRGEFLNGFSRCGLNCFGVDQSLVANDFFPNLSIKQVDMESGKLPFEDETFDAIFSKSVIEHFYRPEILLKELYRILKPGGKIITMTPDWEVIYKMFYDDYTHRTPFTLLSLKDIKIIHGFEQVLVEKFLQLPSVWKFPIIMPFCCVIGRISPKFLRNRYKFLRFSYEMMLLSFAKKPIN